jgi:hypothetical protein
LYPFYREICNQCEVPTQDFFDLAKLKKEVQALIGTWGNGKLNLSDKLGELFSESTTLMDYFESRSLISNISRIIDQMVLLLNEIYPATRFRQQDIGLLDAQEFLVTQIENLKSTLGEIKAKQTANPLKTSLQTYAAKYPHREKSQSELISILTEIDQQLQSLGKMQQIKEDYLRFKETLQTIPPDQMSMSLRHMEMEYLAVLDQLTLLATTNLS